MLLYHLNNILKNLFKASFRIFKELFNNEQLQNKELSSNCISLIMVHITSVKITYLIFKNNVKLLQNRRLTSFNIYLNIS